MNTGRGLMAEMGTTTAALVASGASGGPGTYSTPNNVESWDGTSWTEIAEVNTPRDRQFGNGIQTQALLGGGRAGPNSQSSRQHCKYRIMEWNNLDRIC